MDYRHFCIFAKLWGRRIRQNRFLKCPQLDETMAPHYQFRLQWNKLCFGRSIAFPGIHVASEVTMHMDVHMLSGARRFVNLLLCRSGTLKMHWPYWPPDFQGSKWLRDTDLNVAHHGHSTSSTSGALGLVSWEAIQDFNLRKCLASATWLRTDANEDHHCWLPWLLSE